LIDVQETMRMAQATTPTDTGTAAGQVKEQASQQAQQVKQQAQQATGQAKDRLRQQVDQRSTQAGERAASTASDVRSVAVELRKQGKDQPAKVAEQAADRMERVGGYLKESDAERILGDIEDFGRRKPWAVALGGLALGFAASRFLKASSSRRYQQLQGRSSQPAGPPLPSSSADAVTPPPGYPPATGTAI
jgi:hypothetical protein